MSMRTGGLLMAERFGDLENGTDQQGELFERARDGLQAVMAAYSVRLDGLADDDPVAQQLRRERSTYADQRRRLTPTDPQLQELVDGLPASLRQARGEAATGGFY